MLSKTMGVKLSEYKIVVEQPVLPTKVYSINPEFEETYLSTKNYNKTLRYFTNITDCNNQTALHIAVFNNNLKVIKILVDYGASLFLEDSRDRVYFNYYVSYP